MENLAHSLLGATLAQLGLKEKLPGGTFTLVVAANLPDVDSLSALQGPLYYLYYHRGWTHSLLGCILLGSALSLLLWAWCRSRPSFSLPRVWATLLLVVLTHPLLDYLNSYGLRPYLPFSDARLFGDLLFIVDPYLWLLLGGALLLSLPSTFWSRVLGVSTLCATTVLVMAAGWYERVPSGLPWIWLLSLAALLAARFRWGIRKRGPLVFSLLLTGAYVGMTWVCHLMALKGAQGELAPLLVQGRSLAALPRPAHPLSWDLFVVGEEEIYYGEFHLGKGFRSPLQRYRRRWEEPAVRAALQSCPGKVMARFSRFPFFEIRRGGKQVTVIARDARYARTGERGFGVLRITSGEGADNPFPCPLP